MNSDHQSIWAHEVAMLAPTTFERWVAEVELLLGHDVDGCSMDHDHAGHQDEGVGFSLDDFGDRFDAGQSPAEAVAEVKASLAYTAPNGATA